MKNSSAKNKKLIYLLVIFVIAVITSIGASRGWWGEFSEDPGNTLGDYTQSNYIDEENDFSVHFIDVGQGDCTLVMCGKESLLIDAGENGHETEVINYLRSMKVDKLDYIIATHQHSDHIGGIPEVLEEFEADNIIMPRLTKAQTPTNSTYTAFLKALQKTDAKIISAKPGLKYTLGEAEFEILGPVTNDCEDINSMSAVTKITYGENSFLVTGDAERDEELEIIDNGSNLDCDVLRAGHHGSSTSSCKDFLDAVSPDFCIISCGENNDYGHPHDKVINRLEKYTDEIYRTDICGSIVMTSDGENIEISYKNQ
ncbi:MAG: MBL fold metallo-hydrolase [Clostridia bacterium]|nr:MBL fold metallo-hydrolase [Clostridia bacterium]